MTIEAFDFSLLADLDILAVLAKAVLHLAFVAVFLGFAQEAVAEIFEAGVRAGLEVNTHATDPLKADTNGAGLANGYEVTTSKTDPLVKDADSEGVFEVFLREHLIETLEGLEFEVGGVHWHAPNWAAKAVW